MKKLIIILFMFSFCLTAQIQLSEDWSFKTDKKWHTGLGGGVSALANTLVFLQTDKDVEDIRGSRTVGIFTVVGGSLLWEIMRANGGMEISLTDMSYGIGSAILTGYLTSAVLKGIIKRRGKKSMTIEQTMKLEDPEWAIDNEFLNNK